MQEPSLKARLVEHFAWLGDRGTRGSLADMTGWLRDPHVLHALGAALADGHTASAATLVAGPVSSGLPLAALTAKHLGVGMVAIQKEPRPASDSDRWLTATSPPDYRDRHLTMSVRAALIAPGERVLVVDDWAETGGQLAAVRTLIERAGAEYLGASVIVDALDSGRVRSHLALTSLLHLRELRRA